MRFLRRADGEIHPARIVPRGGFGSAGQFRISISAGLLVSLSQPWRGSETIWTCPVAPEELHADDRGAIGPEPRDLEEIRRRSRILRRAGDIEVVGGRRIEYEPQPRRVEIVVNAVGLEDDEDKAAGTPGVKMPAVRLGQAIPGGQDKRALRAGPCNEG